MTMELSQPPWQGKGMLKKVMILPFIIRNIYLGLSVSGTELRKAL